MKQKLRSPRRALGLAVIAAAAVAAALTAGSSHAAASHSMTPAVGGINVHPLVSAPQHALPGAKNMFGCQSRPIDGSAGARCYTPQQIRQAYGFSSLIANGVTGAGKTIVIIDAFSNPWVRDDLSIEDSTFGLPAPPSFDIVAPQGVPAFDLNDGNQVGWASEISLDVLSAHAMAPDAKIVLVEATSNNDADLLAATKYVVDNHIGDVISQSFGEAEQCMDPSLLAQQHALFAKAVGEGYTIFASSGDSGASQGACSGDGAILAASTPASDPNVTGVGGTTLNATDAQTTPSQPDGTYLGETAWTEIFGCNPPAVAASDVNCSGGGWSTLFGRPAWQQALVKGGDPHPARGVPDVSYDAAVNGGLLIHSGVLLAYYYGLDPDLPSFFIFGGTSAGSPQWAALAADADQVAGHDLGNINRSLYQLAQSAPKYAADFNDVTTGNNDVAEIGGQGYNAAPGWDPVTGLGSPKAANLVPALAAKG
jgi:subtilase family serine protease